MCDREDTAVHSSGMAPAAGGTGGTGGLATGRGKVYKGAGCLIPILPRPPFCPLPLPLPLPGPWPLTFTLREATNRSVNEDAHVSARNLP